MSSDAPDPLAPQATPDRKPPTEGSVSILPPLSALAEIVVLFAVIYAIDKLTPNLAILDLSPHPFWIPVLLVSLQYGTISGFIAAAVAIAISLFSGLPEQDIGENLFAYFLRVLGQPMLWIGVALLVGQFRMRQLGAKHELRVANQALKSQRDDLARHARELRGRVEVLEQELATRYSAPPHTGAAVLSQTMAAGGLQLDGDAQAVLARAAKTLFPGAVLTAYRVRDDIMAEVAVCGRKPDTGPRIRIPNDDPLYRAVILEGRSVSVLEPGSDEVLAQTGLVAVPIPSGRTAPSGSPAPSDAHTSHRQSDTDGQAMQPPDRDMDWVRSSLPIGMLVMERADPAAISPQGILALEMLAHALAPRPPRPLIPKAAKPTPARRIRPEAPLGVAVHPKARQPDAQLPARKVADRRASLVDRLSKGPDLSHASVSITKPVPPLPGEAATPAGGASPDRADKVTSEQ